MPEGLTISTEEVRKASDGIKVKKNKIDDIFNTLNKKMREVSNEWESSGASVMYQEQFKNLSEKFPDFISTLDQYALFLDKVADTYEETDRKATQRLETLQSDYNG